MSRVWRRIWFIISVIDRGRNHFDRGRYHFDRGRNNFDRGRIHFDCGRIHFDRDRIHLGGGGFWGIWGAPRPHPGVTRGRKTIHFFL